MKRLLVRWIAISAACGLAVTAAAVSAQRDPAYAAARASGAVGEKPDGYLAALVPAAQALANDLNIKRRALYTEEARAQTTTIEQVAFVAGCRNIARTVPGEKYQAPDGSWQTRDAGPPIRDSRCP
jgi:uncharacterized protein YdbL (DUF1318 family)